MKSVKRSLFFFFCFAAFAQSAFAQATLSIQGIIQKSNGAAVDDGKYDLTFKLYTVASGGTAVHSETQNIAVAGGIYSAELGSGGTPLTAAFDQTYYLGVAVDGGAELIPRARLTSSPYALALLGTANLFPSSGAIGAGTISPTSGYQMHIKNGSGAGKLLVEGSDAAQIDFKKGSTVGAVGFGTANNDFVVNPGSNNTTLQYNGNTRLTVNNNGVDVPGTLSAGTLTASNFSPANLAVTSKLAVGQGSVDANNAFKVTGDSYMSGHLEINGGKLISGDPWGFTPTSGLYWWGNNTRSFSLRASSYIFATGYGSFSDRRIKKDLRLSETFADLSTLRKLRVTDYRHVDEVNNGKAFTKGFIAQEVEQAFPEAVTKSSNFIPNVYAMSAQTQLTAGKMTISMAKNHEFAVGNEVKIMMPDNSERVLTVAAVPSETSFSVNWTEAAPEKVFVYGKKVADFRTVDYDRIFTLNVSATQELARRVELLEKENAALKSELVKKDGEMKASAEKMDARLRALENKLSN
ncbi:MAG: tail fiber domain-containing protein [Saprospiraceae bacterium]